MIIDEQCTPIAREMSARTINNHFALSSTRRNTLRALILYARLLFIFVAVSPGFDFVSSRDWPGRPTPKWSIFVSSGTLSINSFNSIRPSVSVSTTEILFE